MMRAWQAVKAAGTARYLKERGSGAKVTYSRGEEKQNGRTAMPSQQDNLERRIKERAYQIWLREGQPQARHREHWEQAKIEIVKDEGLDAARLPPSPFESPTGG
jgi:hypothetical protein